MFIIGIGIATPPHRYLQTDCWAAAQASSKIEQLSPRSRALIRKVLLGQNGITSRYLAVDSLQEVFDISPDSMHTRFLRHAPALAAQAGQDALLQAQVNAADIDALLVSTCTGYLCPGLTSYLSEQLGLKPTILPLDLVGQGCGAALPNLRTAEALLSSGRCKHVLSVCVEICSAAFYLDDDPGVLISACLFGDAAGAVVLSQTPATHLRHIEWKAAGSTLNPAARDLLRFEQRQGLLRNMLTPEVPSLAAEAAEVVLDQVLPPRGLQRRDVSTWIWHAGGRDVLLALQKRLNLNASDVAWSATVLKEVGNVSSPFVIHVLQRALANNAPGGWWWMSSFGAGFSCHGALLEVE